MSPPRSRRRFPRRLPIAALAVCLGALARAQKPPTFDPSRDLEGFEACFASEFRDLYPLDGYSELLGRELSAAELADVQKRWKKDRETGDAQLAALRADPPEQSLWLLRNRLARDQYFSKISWTEDRTVPGVVILVQQGSTKAPDYAAGVVREFGPWFAKIQSVFDETYAKPLHLERPPRRALWPIAILSSGGSYVDFLRIHVNFGPTVRSACYDHKLALAVGFVDPFNPDASSIDRRYPMLNALVRGMLDGYSTSPEGRPGALWIEEGLASYLAYHEGARPDCLDSRRIRPETLKAVLAAAQDKNLGSILFHPIEDLVSLRSSEDLDRSVLALAQAAKRPPPLEGRILEAFFGESTLWMHYLHSGMDGSLRDPLLQYLRSALAGEAGTPVLQRAFAGKDLPSIDDAFLAWLVETMKRELPLATVDPAALGALFHGPDGRPRHAGPEAAPEPPKPCMPAVLAIEPTDAESRHGLALLQARSGDLEGAIAELKSIPDASVSATEKPRIARDIARMQGLVRLRDGFLENLRRSGAKWSTELQGKKIVVSIAKVEGGFVHLAENRLGIEKIPLAALDPMEIAKQATNREQQGNSEPWARFYAYVLAEDARWEKLLKDPSDEAKALREDARTWIPSCQRAGRAAAALNALAKSNPPATAGDGDALCAAIRSVLKDYSDVSAVQRKLGDLRRVARASEDAALAEVEPASLLHGRCSKAADGRVTLAYEFDDAVEAQDFQKRVGYLKEWRKAIKVEVLPEDQSEWTVKDGGFQGEGAACYRLPLSFSAPMTVRYEFRILDIGRDADTKPLWVVGVCDDGKENSIEAIGFGDLLVRDVPRGLNKMTRRTDSQPYFLATSYKVEVRHDGTTASVWIEGEKVSEAPCGGLKGGGVYLWFHTPLPVVIERFEVEGTVEPASARALRESVAEKRLVEMGFGRR